MRGIGSHHELGTARADKGLESQLGRVRIYGPESSTDTRARQAEKSQQNIPWHVRLLQNSETELRKLGGNASKPNR